MFLLTTLVIFIVVVALLWNEGFWSNAITVINITVAALLTFNFFEPLASKVETLWDTAPNYTYLWDVLCFWAVFALAYSVLRAVTDAISHHKVRFKAPVELGGRIACSAIAGLLMVALACCSFHVGPLPPDCFGGGFQPKPASNNFFGFGIDKNMLGFVQSCSRGSLSTAELSNFPMAAAEDKGRNVFDPQADFILRYHQRRERLKKLEGFLVPK